MGLSERFEREMASGVPRAEGGGVAGPTPLKDMTRDVSECARRLYGTELGPDFEVYGKMESGLPGGSIKTRPAVHIIREAIGSGELREGQPVIEATSGNFGIALGLLSRAGVKVIALVSRRLQEGVLDQLRGGGVDIIDMDVDICPAPGMENRADELAAKAGAAQVRSRLSEMGMETDTFDAHIAEIESLLGRKDVINLAAYLARIYGMFCPQQYGNELNVEAHRTVTAAELDAQLRAAGQDPGGCQIFCTFGTGGTSGGISSYMLEKYGAKSVHVVFPVPGQDVAGIRTRANAEGLGLYRPDRYASQTEEDFEKARPMLEFMVERGHDMGESSALALRAAVRQAASGGASKFVVIVADGIAKYRRSLGARPVEVSLEEAASAEYDRIVWVHPRYAPREEGLEMLARSLGVEKSRITVTSASDVGELLSTRRIPEGMGGALEGRALLVCMAGNTSLSAAKVLAASGVSVQSLGGGITGLPESAGKPPGMYVQASG